MLLTIMLSPIWGTHWLFDLSAWLAQWITPLSQGIILAFFVHIGAKWRLRERRNYRDENWAQKIHSRVRFKTILFFPIWLLFCWLASENTWYLISYLYLAQLLIGVLSPRVEYRMTQDTEEGWALREYAKKEFNEEKLEQQEYALMYDRRNSPYKKHEYYLWWQMQSERWIFRLKALGQFTRDIICCILIWISAFIGVFAILPAPWAQKHFNFELATLPDIVFTGILWIATFSYLYIYDRHSHRYHAFNYFFYYDYHSQAAGPRKEKPGTWEYYYFILTGKFPEKYRDLQDEQDRQRLLRLGLDPDDDIDLEEIEEGIDAEMGATKVDLDDYDAEGGDYSVFYDPDLQNLQEDEDSEDETEYKRYTRTTPRA